MEEFWVKMKNGIKDGAAFSATKIEQYSKIGKLKIEQFGIRKKIEGLQNDLGVRLYDLIKDGKGSSAGEDIAVISFVEKIDSYEADIETITKQIDTIREESAEKFDTEKGDTEKGDTEKGDTEKGDTEKGDTEKGDLSPDDSKGSGPVDADNNEDQGEDEEVLGI